jgi:peroxiredoxin Q/BCP
MSMPEPGDPAPLFELKDDKGEIVRLKDFRGQRVVLFFYPGADTPGCTKEACSFRDEYSGFTDLEISVLGISPDTVGAQFKFSQKYGFPYPLLADPDHGVAESYGVWGTKKSFGREYEGVHRTTFVIDEDGSIERVFKRVKPEGHSLEVLEYVENSERDQTPAG